MHAGNGHAVSLSVHVYSNKAVKDSTISNNTELNLRITLVFFTVTPVLTVSSVSHMSQLSQLSQLCILNDPTLSIAACPWYIGYIV